MNLYNFITNLDQKTVFLFSVVFAIIIFFFQKINITLGIIVGLCLWIGIVSYVTSHQEQNIINKQIQHDTKLKEIRPIPQNFDKYDDIINFCFSVQDFYAYNPLAYEEMIDNLDTFLAYFDEVKLNPKRTNELFELMNQRRRDAVNALHSTIFNLNDDNLDLTKKLTEAIKQLDDILYTYLDEVKYLHDKNLYDQGININYKPINDGPIECNNFNNASYLQTRNYMGNPNNMYTYDFV